MKSAHEVAEKIAALLEDRVAAALVKSIMPDLIDRLGLQPYIDELKVADKGKLDEAYQSGYEDGLYDGHNV